MVPAFLLPVFLLTDSVVRSDGTGAAVPVEPTRHPSLQITLGITRILEQENLQVSVWGSADGEAWRRLRVFPPKSYCGHYVLPLDLSRHSDVRFLRAHWTVNRWQLSDEAPVFGFSIEMKPAVPVKAATSVHAAAGAA